MRQKTIHILILVLLTSCGSFRNIEIENVQKLSLEIDKSQSINHGSEIQLKVIATMKDDGIVDVTTHPNLKIECENLDPIFESKFRINSHSTSFNDSSIEVRLSLNELSSIESLQLNYSGSVYVRSASIDGESGQDQARSTNTLFGRDGLDGRKGIDGADGEDGHHYTAYLWRQGEGLRLHMQDDCSELIWKYKTDFKDSIYISLDGGKGGNGGRGGDGGDGKSEKKTSKGIKTAGNGGDGGQGGTAGDGGDGGSLILFVHPNAEDFIHTIVFTNDGGYAGKMGSGGVAGRAASSTDRKHIVQDGEHGIKGENGKHGTKGPKPTISLVRFDWNSLP